jgi:hypothetical protein
MIAFLILFLMLAVADELYFRDLSENVEFSWEYLKKGNPYSIVSGQHVIHFSFAEDLPFTCQGQNASVILLSKDKDSCEILGRHEINTYQIVETSNSLGIEIFYRKGSLCRDRLWGDIPRRTEFKFICSKRDQDFILMSSIRSCRTIIQKRGKAGCFQSIVSEGMETLIIAAYFLFRGLFMIFIGFCWILYDILNDDNYSDAFVQDGFAGVVLYGKNKVLAFDDKRKYTEV